MVEALVGLAIVIFVVFCLGMAFSSFDNRDDE